MKKLNRTLMKITSYFGRSILDAVLIYILFRVGTWPERIIALHPSFIEILSICLMLKLTMIGEQQAKRIKIK